MTMAESVNRNVFFRLVGGLLAGAVLATFMGSALSGKARGLFRRRSERHDRPRGRAMLPADVPRVTRVLAGPAYVRQPAGSPGSPRSGNKSHNLGSEISYRQCRGDCDGLAGEFNIGELCRMTFGDDAVLIGFGMDRGTVAAGSDWG